MRHISIDPERLGGTPVFAGTRVPIRNLFDYIAGGEALHEFLRQFPTVSRDEVEAVLDELIRSMERLDNLESQRREVERLWDADRRELAELRGSPSEQTG